eukprot:TRINITY_DN7734_c0_g1_i1.p1 TRINITY_DN7734_c0_g1~~TRINITY_DN7734_c0_g1_i1.p1  ORF type:complete len:905 (-),score=305.36 TRINITY_DN7734_c0_g1_i1:48-2762(-)
MTTKGAIATFSAIPEMEYHVPSSFHRALGATSSSLADRMKLEDDYEPTEDPNWSVESSSDAGSPSDIDEDVLSSPSIQYEDSKGIESEDGEKDQKRKRKEEKNPPKRRRGRPPRSPSKKKEPKVIREVAPLTASTRTLPCFYHDCNYSVKRPGSIIELSDRPLLLPKKFDGSLIPSCKKHQDKRRIRENEASCEICKGLNCPELHPTLSKYANEKGNQFVLCDYCFQRHSLALQLLADTKDSNVDLEELRSQHIEESVQGLSMKEEEDLHRDLKSKRGNDVVYQRNHVTGWEDTHLTYLQNNVWESRDTDLFKLRKATISQDENPYPVSIRNTENGFILFSDSEISVGTCLGQITGRVIPCQDLTEETKKFHRRLSEEYMIDAEEAGNEMRFIGDIFDTSNLNVPTYPNVEFVSDGDMVLVISIRKIQRNDALYADWENLTPKEQQYLDECRYITQFNRETLPEEEAQKTAFDWFLREGHEILQARGKITVPIEVRFPAKKTFASHSLKRSKFMDNSVKREEDWGYVAQLEKLGLMRSREDCWVSFKAGLNWDYESFHLAAYVFSKKYQDQSHKPFDVISPKAITESVPIAIPKAGKPPKSQQKAAASPPKRKEIFPARVKDEIQVVPQHVQEESHVLNSRYIEEILPSELQVGKDSLGTGNISKGLWRGYPVAIRTLTCKHNSPTEEEKSKFLTACSASSMIHPNIVTSYGYTSGEHPSLVMEYMNLGSLKHWLQNTQAHVHAMYIPRIALDIARGMEFIHSKSIVHRSLKSSNVLLKGEIVDGGLIANLEVKIGDLGKIWEDHVTHRPEEIYLAPELIQFKRPYSFESDVYSFGMILCHLFSEGSQDPKLPAEVLPNSRYLESWDDGWKNLIISCAHPNPSLRPAFSKVVDTVTALVAGSDS